MLYHKHFSALTIVIASICTVIVTPFVQATEIEDFISKVKHHYRDAPSPKAYALNYHYLRNQSWDNESPDRQLSIRMVEVDTENKHFYDNDILHLLGGRMLDRVHYQNDTESYRWERNGFNLGKTYVDMGMNSFDRFMTYNIFNLDFFAVSPLLAEKNLSETVQITKDMNKGTTTLRHTPEIGNEVEYTFTTNPIELKVLNNISMRGIYHYDDYQTRDGVRFARSIIKYFNGAKEPSFIHRIDHFREIERVDPDKMRLPAGLTLQELSSDKTLSKEQVGDGLYLISEASGMRNAMAVVNEDDIMLMGVAGNADFAKRTMELIETDFPNKKVTSVYVTSPQYQEIAGLDVFTQKGLIIVADAYTIQTIQNHQKYKNEKSNLKFETIGNEQQHHNTQFFVLENSRSKRQSFAYFADSGVIFQTYFIQVPSDNTIPGLVPSYTTTFINFVRNENLNISRIVSSTRNNNITLETMNRVASALR